MGYATKVELVGADTVVNGDGLLRIGHTLYVVQNRLNLISAFDLDAQATTVARWGNRLYLVNARFTSAQAPDTTFNAVAVSV